VGGAAGRAAAAAARAAARGSRCPVVRPVWPRVFGTGMFSCWRLRIAWLRMWLRLLLCGCVARECKSVFMIYMYGCTGLTPAVGGMPAAACCLLSVVCLLCVSVKSVLAFYLST
jgi:hypothetical protein